MTTALPILTTTVAISQFFELGHTLDEVPTHSGDIFDIRAFPDVYAALLVHQSGPLGIWTTDTVQYRRTADPDMLRWIRHRYNGPRAQAEIYRHEMQPEAILERRVIKNVMTDYGVLTMLHIMGTSAEAQYFNHLQLSTGAETAQVSTAMGTTGVTAIPVISNGVAFTNGMLVTLGFGSANAEIVTIGNGSTATSIVCSATTKTHSVNDWVVQNPSTSDNPSSVTNGYDSGALASGAFVYTGSGAAGRQIRIAYDFPANSSAPGSGYTDLWVASAAIIASNTTAAHLTASPWIVNATTGINVVYSDTM